MATEMDKGVGIVMATGMETVISIGTGMVPGWTWQWDCEWVLGWGQG